MQRSETPVAPAAAGPSLAPLSQSAEPANEQLMSSLPRISREELNRLSQNEFVLKNHGSAEPESAWPVRDPFESGQEPGLIPLNVPPRPVMTAAAPPQPLPVPECVFSGTMIEQDRIVALVDGVPMAVGDRLGIWQIARIETDYIVLKAGSVAHRIEQKGMGALVARQENPL